MERAKRANQVQEQGLGLRQGRQGFDNFCLKLWTGLGA
jgi:hypothetical protein